MAARLLRFESMVPLVGALLLEGCSGISKSKVDSHAAADHRPVAREKQVKVTWIGHPYKELIEVYGAPGMTMHVPAHRPRQVLVSVDEGLDATTTCIDAFAVVKYKGQPVIDDYFCR